MSASGEVPMARREIEWVILCRSRPGQSPAASAQPELQGSFDCPDGIVITLIVSGRRRRWLLHVKKDRAC